MEDPWRIINEKQQHFLLASYSALDKYFRITEPGCMYLHTDLSLISLAKSFSNLAYPGFPLEDAIVLHEGSKFSFRCVDSLEKIDQAPFTVMQLLYNLDRDVFLDYRGIYRDLRDTTLIPAGHNFTYELELMEAARLISRYHYQIDENFYLNKGILALVSPAEQQELLIAILSSDYPQKGLTLLYRSGFLEQFWPEIFKMVNVKQTKDYHPEGDVWQHTLETLKHRKKNDLLLSLALLFHDSGKPEANGTMDKPFERHSELGTQVAAGFLKRLGFNYELIKDVCFLIRYHMLPAALKKLPLYRTEKIMDSPLFPLLLEVYRADASASFTGPAGYYEACRIYRGYLRQSRNPYKIKMMNSMLQHYT